MAGSTMPCRSRPSSTNSAVSSRNPPSRISANGREIGGSPARRKPGLSLRSTSMSVRRSIANRFSGRAFAPSAGRLADLFLPVSLGVGGRPDVGDQVLVVPAEHLDQALFLAGELLVEGALRGARVPDDVGDRGVAITALTDRCGQPVE